jgi:hypothetical protein
MDAGSQKPTSLLRNVRAMDAVDALYSADNAPLADALFSRLSETIFDRPAPPPARPLQQLMARLTCRIVKRTTVREGSRYRNRLLEHSGHPYAQALLASSTKETQALVEGGDPMNGPYMMLVPEIRESATLWDRLFFSSVQGKDVQLRFLWEARATQAEARKRLAQGRPVRITALAAGTGLNLILAYDRLVREGAQGVVAEITDRDPANTAKTSRLLAKLAPVRGWKLGSDGISARTEDIFEEPRTSSDVVTTVGILEYLQGFTCDTTERRRGLAEPEEPRTIRHLAVKLGAMTAPEASVIANTFRPHASTRLLELFGKQFDYRNPADLDAAMAEGGFVPSRSEGSALVYDVRVYDKSRKN